MKKNAPILILISFILFSIKSPIYGQITLYSNGFEGTNEDTYNLTTSAGANVDFGNFDTADYILRGNPTTNAQLTLQPTGFGGNNLIMWEDFDDYLTGDQQLYLTTNDIDINGAVDMSISLKIGITNNTSDLHETADLIIIECQIDAGPWIEIGNFRGEKTQVSFNFYEDDDLDGIYTEQITNVMKQVNYNLNSRAGTTISGTTMKARVRAFSGVQEEMVIDDLVVEATSILGINDIELTTEVNIYPNPSTDHIQVNKNLITQNYTIYNELGVEIIKGINLDNKIDIQNLKPGFYLLKFENTSSIKFIKK